VSIAKGAFLDGLKDFEKVRINAVGTVGVSVPKVLNVLC
jgi:hypothetical protein